MRLRWCAARRGPEPDPTSAVVAHSFPGAPPSATGVAGPAGNAEAQPETSKIRLLILHADAGAVVGVAGGPCRRDRRWLIGHAVFTTCSRFRRAPSGRLTTQMTQGGSGCSQHHPEWASGAGHTGRRRRRGPKARQDRGRSTRCADPDRTAHSQRRDHHLAAAGASGGRHSPATGPAAPGHAVDRHEALAAIAKRSSGAAAPLGEASPTPYRPRFRC